MITIENVSKSYEVGGRLVPALRDIRLDIAKGEVFGVIGRSGAGKSTLIRTLNLLERPSSGRILLDGEDITALDSAGLQKLRQRVGMVFQHFNLLSAKTVAANIRFPLKLAGKYSAAEMDARVDELLELVGLREQRDKYPSQLSGGQKQRVGIARALANHPDVLLCDEATSALDPETTQSILRLLLDINRRLGLTIVLITHEMQVIRAICDRVAVIEGGEIVETGNVADVFLHPQRPVTQLLVAEGSGIDAAEWTLLRDQAKGPLLKLTFTGDTTYQPILSAVMLETNVRLNILQGSIGRIKDTPYGQLLVELVGDELNKDQLAASFARHGIHYEVLN